MGVQYYHNNIIVVQGLLLTASTTVARDVQTSVEEVDEFDESNSGEEGGAQTH